MSLPSRISALALAAVLSLPALPAGVTAQDSDLALQLSNPVASLVSVPLQFNWDGGVGPGDDTRMTMNFQPVIPLSLNDDWNLILRWIMPFVSQPALSTGGLGAEPVFGLSDIVASTFFSPAEAGSWIWGVGPVFGLPTTSDPRLGTEKFSVGPTAVVLQQNGGWTYGALANHLWSIAGDDDRGDVSSTFLQPFLTYTTSNAVTFAVNTEASINWEGPEGNRTTMPLNFSVAKVTTFGPFPFQIQLGAGTFIEAPNDQPDWRFRVAYTVLLPRG